MLDCKMLLKVHSHVGPDDLGLSLEDVKSLGLGVDSVGDHLTPQVLHG